MENREIKFRVWHLDDGMLYFDFDSFKKDYHDQYGNIMQFTGLKDKNGVDIYEGDIVQSKSGDIMRVSWNEKFASFCLDKKGWLFSHYFGEAVDPNDCEIIGNIHEHPHLIK